MEYPHRTWSECKAIVEDLSHVRLTPEQVEVKQRAELLNQLEASGAKGEALAQKQPEADGGPIEVALMKTSRTANNEKFVGFGKSRYRTCGLQLAARAELGLLKP